MPFWTFIGILLLWAPALQAQAPNAPTNLSVTASSATTLRLTWQDNATNEEGFDFELSTNNGAFVPVGFVGANLLGANFTGAAPSTNYRFRMRAYVGSGASRVYSDYSNESAATTPSASTVPPTGLNFTNIQKTTARINWTDTNPNEDGYQVDFRKSAADPFVTLSSSVSNATGLNVSGLTEATSYEFQVRGFTNTSPRTYSEPITVMMNTRDAIISAPWHFHTVGKLTDAAYELQHSSLAGTPTVHSISGLPPGLSYQASTKSVTGQPTMAGTWKCQASMTWPDGWADTQQVVFRVFSRPVFSALPALYVRQGASAIFDASGSAVDPDGQKAARVTTTLGTMDVVLFQTAAPLTTNNFLRHANAGDWTGSCFHRAIPNFVIQGGGFKPLATGLANFTKVVAYPAVLNEPGLSNLPGTLAMAKLGGNPNSATNQWFINTEDNSANLDAQNGGFTVFGRVAGAGMVVANAIQNSSRATYSINVDGVTQSFSDFPMTGSAPPTMDNTRVIQILSVAEIPVLEYTASSLPSAPFTQSRVGAVFTVQGTSAGRGVLTLTATDRDDSTAQAELEVVVTQSYADWDAQQNFANGDSGPTADPDGDGVVNFLEYSLGGNPKSEDPAATAPLPLLHSSERLALRFPKAKTTQDIIYTVEGAFHLSGPWSEVWISTQGLSHNRVAAVVDLPDHQYITITDSQPISSGSTRFLRLRVAQ